MASLGLIGLVGGLGEGMVENAKTAEKRDFETWRMEILQGYKIADENRAEDRTIAAEQRGLASRAQERAAIHGETVQRAPELRQIKSEDVKASKLAEYDPDVTDARLGTEEKVARTKSRVEREELIATGTDPNYLKAKRNLAQATHIEGLGSVATAELAKYSLAEKQKVAELIDRFESTDDPVEKAKIKESLTVRGIIKPGEFDTEKITEESYDEAGNLIKRERTQKRRPEASSRTSGKQDVRVAGQVIGQASTPEEAQQLVAQWKAGKTSAPAVDPRRPLYNASNADLQRLAKKPRGVSTEEANAAFAELQARKGEGRLSSF